MDLARYSLLLSRGVFFARADTFEDRWEGSWGRLDLQRFRERHAGLDRGALEAEWKRVEETRVEALRATGVSCWHQSEHESAALWELYLPRGLGVAVRSSVRRVQGSLQAANRSVRTIAVNYSDYSSLELGTDAAQLLGYKRSEFSHEREVRFLVEFRKDELDRMDGFAEAHGELSRRVIAPGPPKPVLRVFLSRFSGNVTRGVGV
jgi:hypothetical protein